MLRRGSWKCTFGIEEFTNRYRGFDRNCNYAMAISGLDGIEVVREKHSEGSSDNHEPRTSIVDNLLLLSGIGDGNPYRSWYTVSFSVTRQTELNIELELYNHDGSIVDIGGYSASDFDGETRPLFLRWTKFCNFG